MKPQSSGSIGLAPAYWETACRALGRIDPIMKHLIKQFPESVLISRRQPFVTLVRSIVGQQISVRAADAIWQRFSSRIGDVNPDGILSVSEADLRAVGLSLRKVTYLHHLSERFKQGLISPESWPEMTDFSIIEELTQTRGIGVWTAEMLLIFNLQRPDVFPLDDIGLQKAVALHYFDGVRPTRGQLREFGERWSPWRSVATWYLWRSLDPVPVEY